MLGAAALRCRAVPCRAAPCLALPCRAVLKNSQNVRGSVLVLEGTVTNPREFFKACVVTLLEIRPRPLPFTISRFVTY
jgi:hypothetical protein